VRTKLAKALGPLDRKFSLTWKSGMFATRSGTGAWGLDRQLSVGDGDAPAVVRALQLLAQHELPLVRASLWYQPEGTAGTAKGAAAVLKALLAAPSAAGLERLAVLLHRVPVDPALTKILVAGVKRATALAELDLRAGGGSNVAPIVAAAPSTLRTLALVNVGATGPVVRSLARAKSLANLQHLELNDEFDDAAIAAILAATWAPTLRSLHLAPSPKTTSNLRGVTNLAAIEVLHLARVSPAGMTALAAAPGVANLRELRLREAILDDALGAKLASHGLPALEVLHVKYATADASALDPIVRAAPKLRLIEVPAGLKVPKSWTKRGRQIL
jgi:hypothetical protein